MRAPAVGQCNWTGGLLGKRREFPVEVPDDSALPAFQGAAYRRSRNARSMLRCASRSAIDSRLS